MKANPRAIPFEILYNTKHFVLFAGVILSTEESVSAVRLAVDYVNKMGLIGPNHRLTIVANTTGDIATTDTIQLGNAQYSLMDHNQKAS